MSEIEKMTPSESICNQILKQVEEVNQSDDQIYVEVKTKDVDVLLFMEKIVDMALTYGDITIFNDYVNVAKLQNYGIITFEGDFQNRLEAETMKLLPKTLTEDANQMLHERRKDKEFMEMLTTLSTRMIFVNGEDGYYSNIAETDSEENHIYVTIPVLDYIQSHLTYKQGDYKPLIIDLCKYADFGKERNIPQIEEPQTDVIGDDVWSEER